MKGLITTILVILGSAGAARAVPVVPNFQQGSIATATQTSAGGAYTFSQSFIEGDVISTTAPALGAVSAYSDQTSTAIGTGTGTGTVTSAHAVTAVGGGTGTVTTGQFVTELSIN